MKIKRRLLISISLLAVFCFSSGFNYSHKYDSKLFRYVDRIVRMVEWKNNKLPNNEFVIGYIGDHHLYKISSAFFQGKTYHNKPIIVKNYHSMDQVKNLPPRLLYIGKNKNDHIEELHKLCFEKHILSISDDQVMEDEKKHPIILLHLNGDNVEMVVDRTEAEKQSFKLSYHLLRAAKEIK